MKDKNIEVALDSNYVVPLDGLPTYKECVKSQAGHPSWREMSFVFGSGEPFFSEQYDEETQEIIEKCALSEALE